MNIINGRERCDTSGAVIRWSNSESNENSKRCQELVSEIMKTRNERERQKKENKGMMQAVVKV